MKVIKTESGSTYQYDENENTALRVTRTERFNPVPADTTPEKLFSVPAIGERMMGYRLVTTRVVSIEDVEDGRED